MAVSSPSSSESNRTNSPAAAQHTATTSTLSSAAASSNTKNDPSTLTFVVMTMMVATSAGMALYMRQSNAMLNRIKEVNRNYALRNPPKFGPPTKAEYEKMRPRWGPGDDD